MRVHDVSLTLRPDMVTWPGEPGPRIEPLRRIANGDSAALWCVAHGFNRVGTDYLPTEPQGPAKAGYPVHHTLLRARVVIVEGLALRDVTAGSYELVCAPLKLGGGDGAPARVFLIE